MICSALCRFLLITNLHPWSGAEFTCSGTGPVSGGQVNWLTILNKDGSPTDVRNCQIPQGWQSSPERETGIFGAQCLADVDRADEPVYLCEGEWDAFALEWLRRQARRPGIVLAVPGASNFKLPWWPWFAGRDVCICYDNDEAGAKGELKVFQSLKGIAASVRCLRWDDQPDGFDLSDFIRKELSL